jgi:hypothetical protein
MEVLKYNWKILMKECDGRCNKLIKLLRILTGIEPPLKKYSINISNILKERDNLSYSLNIKEFLLHKNSTNADKCLALYLGSKRNYADYIQYKDSSLPLILVEDEIDLDIMLQNPLINIDEDIINFKYN